MDYKELANLIFPNTKDYTYYEEKYPRRNLLEGMQVTRMAPSPTGFVHIGSLLVALLDQKIAKQSKGVFVLRIEDTDQKREVENGVAQIINAFKKFDIIADEGNTDENNEDGKYGPYKQSLRKEIYESYAKLLVEKGLAYPCFCASEDLEEMRLKQENAKLRPGYYGVWAKCRNITVEEAIKKIKNGEKYILRFKSMGKGDKKIKHHDLIKGNIDFPENDQDIVIIKSDGLPTYHFAHAVDDHLMGTTIVIRGDEWLSSVPLHLQLFQELGFKAPKYAHIPPIMKDDNGSKRKISKRKDPEAAVNYYSEIGIPNQAVKEYLLNIANSNFEGWRKANPEESIEKFDFQLNKMGVSGALFDMVKLLDISKNIISKYSAEEIYENSINWAREYNLELKNLLEANKEYAIKVFNIERGNSKPRKDISKWEDILYSIEYMYEELYNKIANFEFQKINNMNEIKTILKEYLDTYFNISDDKQIWFEKIKEISEKFGYAKEVKAYKNEPEKYKGHVGDVSTVIRVVVTGRQNTPDLYEIMQVLGEEKVKERINRFIQNN